MDLHEAGQLAFDLMHKHNMFIKGWRVEWDNAKRRAGLCSFRRTVISLSRPVTAIHTVEKVRDTILHEIAHALVGSRHGHDRTWKLKAIEIGAKPERCYNAAEGQVPGNYKSTCPNCGTNREAYKKPCGKHFCVPCYRKTYVRYFVTWIDKQGNPFEALPRVRRVRVNTLSTWFKSMHDNVGQDA